MPGRIEQIRQMLAQEPNDEFLQYALAMEYMSVSDWKQAIAILEKIVASNSSYLAAYYQLGKCFEAEGNTEQALKTYQAGVTVAEAQKNTKTANELKEAIFLLED